MDLPRSHEDAGDVCASASGFYLKIQKGQAPAGPGTGIGNVQVISSSCVCSRCRSVGERPRLAASMQASKRRCHHQASPSGSNSLSGLIQLRNSESVLLKAPPSVSSTAVLPLEDIARMPSRRGKASLEGKTCMTGRDTLTIGTVRRSVPVLNATCILLTLRTGRPKCLLPKD